MTKLYIVPTPIGNMEDITLRALKVLQTVEVILTEDTRHTSKLLHHYNISKKLISYHQHNEHKKTNAIIEQLKMENEWALVSDAGTPGISDAGFLLVRTCIQSGIAIECLPGATAFVPALILSGLPFEKFCFEGFLPHKKGRQKRLSELSEEKRTLIFYESTHRLLKTLNQMAEIFGQDRMASVSRELTKIHEETQRGTLQQLIHHFENNVVKGEMVIVVDGK